jgi:hypothetical protein
MCKLENNLMAFTACGFNFRDSKFRRVHEKHCGSNSERWNHINTCLNTNKQDRIIYSNIIQQKCPHDHTKERPDAPISQEHRKSHEVPKNLCRLSILTTHLRHTQALWVLRPWGNYLCSRNHGQREGAFLSKGPPPRHPTKHYFDFPTFRPRVLRTQ